MPARRARRRRSRGTSRRGPAHDPHQVVEHHRHKMKGEAVMKRIVVLGGGVGGTLVANLLAKHLRPGEAEIVVVSASSRHVYQPGWLYVPFGHQDPLTLS